MRGRRRFGTSLGASAVAHLTALILVYALFGNSLWAARTGLSARGSSSPEESNKNQTLQERILEIPRGTMIEVRLLNKQKLRGRLCEVDNEGFSLQTAQGSKIETQKIAFTAVKNFKSVEGTTGKKIGTGLLYALAGIGVLAVILIIWGVSQTSG